MDAKLSPFVVRGRPFREVAVPGWATWVQVRRGSASAHDGVRWWRGTTGDVLFVVGCQLIRLLEPATEATCLGLSNDAPCEHGSFMITHNRLADDEQLSTLATWLADTTCLSDAGPAATAHTHLLKAFLVRARAASDGVAAIPVIHDEAVARALALVRSDWSRRFTVSKLARAVGLSRAAFARRFRDALGTSPDRYVSSLRLQRSARRLAESDAGLAAIAAEHGYASAFAFSRAFKRHHGITPAHFRARWRGGHAPIRMAA